MTGDGGFDGAYDRLGLGDGGTGEGDRLGDQGVDVGATQTEPLVGGQQERAAKPLSGVLYNLGFKETASVEDMGIPFAILLLILVGILFALLAMTVAQTYRTREGN